MKHQALWDLAQNYLTDFSRCCEALLHLEGLDSGLIPQPLTFDDLRVPVEDGHHLIYWRRWYFVPDGPSKDDNQIAMKMDIQCDPMGKLVHRSSVELICQIWKLKDRNQQWDEDSYRPNVGMSMLTRYLEDRIPLSSHEAFWVCAADLIGQGQRQYRNTQKWKALTDDPNTRTT